MAIDKAKLGITTLGLGGTATGFGLYATSQGGDAGQIKILTAKNDQLESEKKTLVEEKEVLVKAKEDLSKEKNSLVKDNESLTNANREFNAGYNKLQDEITESKARVSELETANQGLLTQSSTLTKTNKDLASALDAANMELAKKNWSQRYLVNKDTSCVAVPNSSTATYYDITCDAVETTFNGWQRINKGDEKFSELEKHYKDRVNKPTIYKDHLYKIS